MIGNVLNTALVATATESSVTASVCRAYSALHATGLVQPELGVQTVSICVTAPNSNTLPAVIQRCETRRLQYGNAAIFSVLYQYKSTLLILLQRIMLQFYELIHTEQFRLRDCVGSCYGII